MIYTPTRLCRCALRAGVDLLASLVWVLLPAVEWTDLQIQADSIDHPRQNVSHPHRSDIGSTSVGSRDSLQDQSRWCQFRRGIVNPTLNRHGAFGCLSCSSNRACSGSAFPARWDREAVWSEMRVRGGWRVWYESTQTFGPNSPSSSAKSLIIPLHEHHRMNRRSILSSKHARARDSEQELEAGRQRCR